MPVLEEALKSAVKFKLLEPGDKVCPLCVAIEKEKEKSSSQRMSWNLQVSLFQSINRSKVS